MFSKVSVAIISSLMSNKSAFFPSINGECCFIVPYFASVPFMISPFASLTSIRSIFVLCSLCIFPSTSIVQISSPFGSTNRTGLFAQYVYGLTPGYLSDIGSTESQMEREELWYRAEGGYREQGSGDRVRGMETDVLRGKSTIF